MPAWLQAILDALGFGNRPPRPPVDPIKPPVPPSTGLEDIPQQLLDAENIERRRYGKSPVARDPRADQMALEWATEEARTNTMSHAGYLKRVNASGYPYSNAGENVAAGQVDVAQVMSDWMNSPAHKANILGDYHHFGGAMVQASNGIRYWCTEFFRPATAPALRGMPTYSLGDPALGDRLLEPSTPPEEN